MLSCALPSAASADDPAVHVVSAGQTLRKIARRYNVEIDAICRANGIRRSAPIRPGQKLLIPAPGDDGSQTLQSKAELASIPERAEPKREPASRHVHTVYAGQTLGKIAKRYNISIEALCQANGIARSSSIQ